MKRISPKDLISILYESKYYYFLVRSKIVLFGGNLTYVFHKTSDALLSSEELLGGDIAGFHTFVDFIDAKRNDEIIKLGSKLEFDYPMPIYTKAQGAQIDPYDPLFIPESNGVLYWHINDLEGDWREQKLVLTPAEEKYPMPSTHSIESCCGLVKAETIDGFYEHWS